MDSYDGLPAAQLAQLRAELPTWGILFDPGRRLYLAVRGQRQVITSATPQGLLEQITGQAGPRTAPPIPAPAPGVRDWRQPAGR